MNLDAREVDQLRAAAALVEGIKKRNSWWDMDEKAGRYKLAMDGGMLVVEQEEAELMALQPCEATEGRQGWAITNTTTVFFVPDPSSEPEPPKPLWRRLLG